MKNVVENREYISYNKILSRGHLKACVSPVYVTNILAGVICTHTFIDNYP